MADGTRYEEGSEFAELLENLEFWYTKKRTKEAFAFYELEAEDPETCERQSVETRQPPSPPHLPKTNPLKGTAGRVAHAWRSLTCVLLPRESTELRPVRFSFLTLRPSRQISAQMCGRSAVGSVNVAEV